ncbi:hypothetical protein QZH41_004799, partial [Actinostola sp. cb2023]
MKLCLICGLLAVLVVHGLSMDATLETDEIPALLKLLNDVSEEHDIPALLKLPNDVSGEAKRGGGDVLHHLHCLELHKAGYCKYGLIKNKFCKKTCFLCNIEPLGMQSRAIPDARITASSMWDGNHAPAQGRLNYKPPRGKAGSWSSRHNRVGQWIQVDLKRVTKVAGIATQGRSNANQWVKQYKLQYSSDGKTFNNYEGDKVFAANKDRNSVVKHNLYKPIIARLLTIMESELVDPGWMKFNCKSGELLFYYNKDTAEHKFPMWNSTSREYCMGETIDASGCIVQESNLEREIPGGSEESSVSEDTNVFMESERVDPGWMNFNCKSGELLFYYNKDTAEHKFPMWNSTSREYCMSETIDGELLQTNKNNSIAIQTDDTGCSNRCTSMYVENGSVLQQSNLEREIPGGSEESSPLSRLRSMNDDNDEDQPAFLELGLPQEAQLIRRNIARVKLLM